MVIERGYKGLHTGPHSNKECLRHLADMEGYKETIDLLDDLVSDVDILSNGICTQCLMPHRVEPDCTNGKCDECGRRTVKHAFVLSGIL